MLNAGQLLAERYRLSHRIATGGMGDVWEAADVRLDRNVAVKILKPELCGHAEFLHRFRTEARTTASLNHPGVAAVHDYGEIASMPELGDAAYLVMELVEGEPLAGILVQQGRLPEDRTLDMLEQAGNALQAAHEQGLVHRDVKPGNILVSPNGTVKLTDFGIAKAADAAPVTQSGMVMGTAHYIAPEQAVGHDATPASDVYSLAVVGYECLKGHRPFLADSAVTVAMMHIRDAPPPLPPDVHPSVRALIEATLVKDPHRRYRTGGEFAAAVAAIRAGHPPPMPSAVVVPAQPQPGTRSNPSIRPVMPAPVAAHPATANEGPVDQGNSMRSGPRPASEPMPSARPVETGPPTGPITTNSQGPINSQTHGVIDQYGVRQHGKSGSRKVALLVLVVVALLAALFAGVWGAWTTFTGVATMQPQVFQESTALRGGDLPNETTIGTAYR